MEEVDVAIVGAGVAGLAAAVALRRVNPSLRIKVLETRSAPSTKYGGSVKLQPNGLKAAAAISPALSTGLQRIGLPEKRTLLHGEDGRLVTRLDTHTERLGGAPSGAEDYLPSFDEEEEAEEAEQQRKQRRSPSKQKSVGGRGGPSGGWGAGPSGSGGYRGGPSGQAEAERQAERRRFLNVDEDSQNLIVGWFELERLLLSLLPSHTVEYECNFLKYSESEGGVVAIFEGLAYPLRTRVLLGADGPFSNVRAQCVQDSEPAYDRTVKWVGRLDGHHVSTTPLDFCAWWVKKGQVFVSHPLANGDVGWEALVSDRELETAGYSYDEGMGRVLPVGSEREIKEKGGVEELPPSKALQDVFRGWPRAVGQMISYTAPEAVLESGVYIRSASDMPPSMGKGRVTLLGEAAHPLRPTGQDTNMALEDAAELAAYVQDYGLTKEALRRYDVCRRPRWRHVMQLTLAQGASTTTGITITHGFLDYTQDLFRRDFKPLGKAARKRAQARHGLIGTLLRLSKLSILAAAVATVTLGGANLLPDFKEAEVAVTEAVEKQQHWARVGLRKLKGAGGAAKRALAKTPPAKVAGKEVHVVKEYVGTKAEGAANTAIDVVGTVAKRSLRNRIAHALGAF